MRENNWTMMDNDNILKGMQCHTLSNVFVILFLDGSVALAQDALTKLRK